MDRRPSRRLSLSAFTLSTSTAATVLGWLPAVAAQSASPTAVPTEPVATPGGVGIAPLGFLIAALVVGGLLIGASAAVISIALVKLLGPFSDRVHLALPVVIGSIPTAVLVNSFGINLLLILVFTELVVLPATGLLLRHRYSRTRNQ